MKGTEIDNRAQFAAILVGTASWVVREIDSKDSRDYKDRGWPSHRFRDWMNKDHDFQK